MSLDRENPMQLEAVKTEQDQLKKFKMYLEYLRGKFSANAADLLEIKIENLGQVDLDVYKKTVSYFKSLNADNCNTAEISTKCKELNQETRPCSDLHFGSWIRNEISAFSMAKFLSSSWQGDGEEDKGIKFLVEYAISHTDPENLF